MVESQAEATDAQPLMQRTTVNTAACVRCWLIRSINHPLEVKQNSCIYYTSKRRSEYNCLITRFDDNHKNSGSITVINWVWAVPSLSLRRSHHKEPFLKGRGLLAAPPNKRLATCDKVGWCPTISTGTVDSGHWLAWMNSMAFPSGLMASHRLNERPRDWAVCTVLNAGLHNTRVFGGIWRLSQPAIFSACSWPLVVSGRSLSDSPGSESRAWAWRQSNKSISEFSAEFLHQFCLST